MKQTEYIYPCNLDEIMQTHISSSSSLLRMHMTAMLADLIKTYSQNEIDENVYLDIDPSGEITGIDVSRLLIGPDVNMCIESCMIKLGEMTADAWKTMKIK